MPWSDSLDSAPSAPSEGADLPRARLRVGIGAVVVLLAVALTVGIIATALAPGGSTVSVGAVVPAETSSAPSGGTDPGAGAATGASDAVASGSEIYVHVLGRVANPGLYVLREGDRVVDAVAAAGGFRSRADRGAINLARELSDGEQLLVPRRGAGGSGGTGSSSGSGSSAGALVNVNTADQTTLETLPGIGPALAQRIIAWREQNGDFASVQDLLAVSGIGEATLAGFVDLVTV